MCRYRGGIRGHIKLVVQDLLKEYLRVEKQFQQASYDKCVGQMREAAAANMASVTADIFSNSQVQHKNILVIELIVSSQQLCELFVEIVHVCRAKRLRNSDSNTLFHIHVPDHVGALW